MRGEARGGGRAALAIGIVAVAVGAAACGPAAATSAPPPIAETPVVTNLVPTPWPQGTVGRYGLRIDPTLLGGLPRTVSGQPVVEAADIESQALDDADLGASLDSIAAGRVGSTEDANWVYFTVARPKDGVLTDEFYAAWRDDYAKKTCAVAGAIASTGPQTIGTSLVDVTTCTEGARSYVMRLGDDLIVSATDLGSRQLGRQLVEALD